MTFRTSRREFITVLWKSLLGLSGGLSLAGLCRFLGYQVDPSPPASFDLGPLESFTIRGRTYIPEAQAILVHEGEQLVAYSLVCPHLGCVVEESAQGFTCPCHGSSFTPDGELTNGPADSPLKMLRLEQTSDGHLILHR